jgi:hypothetical protein
MGAGNRFHEEHGRPGGAVVGAAILEFFGGFFLIAGFIVPIVALFFAIQFAAIIVMKKRKMKSVHISPGKPNYEIDATYLSLSLVLLVPGAPGRFRSTPSWACNETIPRPPGHPPVASIRAARISRLERACCWRIRGMPGPADLANCRFRVV